MSGSAASLPTELDGTDISPLFFGQTFDRSNGLYFHSPHYIDGGSDKTPRSAIVKDSFKLTVDYDSGTFALYNLTQDIGELTDIKDAHLEKLYELRLELRNHLKSVNTNMPSLNEGHIDFPGMAGDADADGLQDDWELINLLTHLEGPNDDGDNDGYTNLEEQTNNTDPMVAEAIFKCQEDYTLNHAMIRTDQTGPASRGIQSHQQHEEGTVLYVAGESITLSSGFTVSLGTDFTAKIETCTPAFEAEEIAENRLAYPATNFEKTVAETAITIFPNPTNSYFSLKGLDHLSPNDVELTLFDLKGQILKLSKITHNQIDVNALPKGIYYVRINLVDEAPILKKIIVQ